MFFSGRLAARLIVLCALLLSVSAHAADAEDRLGVPGPVRFDGGTYSLAWSARPSPGYTKQEYLPAGQALETYASMLLIELLEGGIDVDGAVAAQVNLLGQRRGSDPLVNMDLIRNPQTGEAILDFIVSSSDGEAGYVAEWNAYRYSPYTGADGRHGVLLFGISHRGYGNDGVRAFLTELKRRRPDQIAKVASFTLPPVTPLP